MAEQKLLVPQSERQAISEAFDKVKDWDDAGQQKNKALHAALRFYAAQTADNKDCTVAEAVQAGFEYAGYVRR